MEASIDRHGRFVLVPSNDKPEDLFLNRRKVDRECSVAVMDRAIAKAASRENP